MQKNAQCELILKLCTISFIRWAQQQRLTYKIYNTAIFFAGNTDRYISQTPRDPQLRY